jgi:hypothetical protein
MTVYIAGPDGKPIAFATSEEAEAYRKARREAEPPLLRCLRKHCAEVHRLHDRAHDALAQPHGRGRGATLVEIDRRLNSLFLAMLADIKAAEREIAAKEPKP